MPPNDSSFRLDRDRLAAWLRDEFGEVCSIDGDGGLNAAVATFAGYARDADAVRGHEDVEVAVYEIDDDALLVAVRERDLPRCLRWPLRQAATYSFAVKEVAGPDDVGFEAACEVLSAVLRRASDLLPSLFAMQQAECLEGPSETGETATVFRLLDAWSGHLAEAERTQILFAVEPPAGTARTGPLPRIVPHAYGAFVHVPALEDEDLVANDEELAESYPSLHAVLRVARRRGCHWINFDTDAAPVEDLPEPDTLEPEGAPTHA